MGKKDKNKKKGKGADKTSAKTDKKLAQKQKKELAAIGEDDIEKIVAEIELEEKHRLQVTEQVVTPPSRRVNFTLTAHPDKEELILFGGEYFNGQKEHPQHGVLVARALSSSASEPLRKIYVKNVLINKFALTLTMTAPLPPERHTEDALFQERKTFLYNDLFFYNIPRNEWSLVKAPGGPPPRCGHQTIAIAVGKGQIWVFGGEYASPTQTQFYHYRDLWVFHLATKVWEKINAAGGPSARSGHRMVYVKKQLIVFGGFHDNLRDYKYFNDVYVFNLETYSWKKLEPTGTGPVPRSGCQMAALADGRVFMFGGYSKERIKKDVDKGVIHTDMFLLVPEKNDMTGLKWKWVLLKQSGARPSPRCGLTLAVAPSGKAFTFGGVWDIEESEEDLAGMFFNDLHQLDLERGAWRTIKLVGKCKVKLRRSNAKSRVKSVDMEGSQDEEDETMAQSSVSTMVSDDGIFQVTVCQAAASLAQPSASSNCNDGKPDVFVPSPRINCGLVVKHGKLYLYGGMVEDGDKQSTLSDLYSLDICKLDEWKVLIPSDLQSQEWLNSSSSEEEEEEEEEDEFDSEDNSEDDTQMETD